MDKPREIALKALYQIHQEQAYSNLALDELLKQNQTILKEKDIGFISEIVYGVTTWKLTIDELIKKYSKIRLKKISPWILNIIRMGIYQIVFLDKVPKSAAVNESVILAKRYGHSSSAGFVNAILRKIEKEDYQEFFRIKEPISRISKVSSMPEWIVKKLVKERGEDATQEICMKLNQKPNLLVRINSLKLKKQDFILHLKKESISYVETEFEDFLVLKGLKNLEQLDLFQQGEFTIQDLSAGMAVRVLNPKKGESILDACSAPGGKTTYIAERMENQGEIEAWDIYQHRISLIEENAKRLGISIISTKLQDASKMVSEKKEKFDKILLDVPCLGIGVIKRKPDIRWQRKEEDILEITKIQEKILENCASYLKRGGILVYSTCSILEEENERVVKKFLEKNSQFEWQKIKVEELKGFEKYQTKEGMLKIDPDEQNDGFFIAKLRKK